MKYFITVADRAGEFEHLTIEGLSEAIEKTKEAAQKYPDKIVVVANDNCDYDWDGLTEEERDLFDEAIYQGKTAAKDGV